MEEGSFRCDKGTLEKAVAQFQDLASRHPTDYRVLYYLARAYERLVWTDRAIFDEENGGRSPSEKEKEALETNLTKGMEAIERSLQLKEDFADSHRLKGSLWAARVTGFVSRMRHGSRARKAVERALQMEPQNPWAIIAQGQLTTQDVWVFGDGPEKTMSKLRAVVGQHPQLVEAYVLLGKLHRKLNQPKDALKMYQKAYEVNPNYPGITSLIVDIVREE
ncbi:MAG: tetratricopeptide repeat protein [Nitrospinae bacterium]|nr:tetratricopeptide repeat protein [Nitrospinota bacterium]